MEGPVSYSFPKKQHLCSRKIIDSLFAQGKTFSIGPFRMYYIMGPPAEAPFQILFAVPKRAHKRAVHRNQIRRRMREAFRLNYPGLLAPILEGKQVPLAVICLYLPHEIYSYSRLEPKMQQVLSRLSQLVEKVPDRSVSVAD